MKDDYDMLMIDLDNGKSVTGNIKQFLKRMTEFAQVTRMSIQMVYYPPYHSKYNMIERFWTALKNYWSLIILDTIQNTISVAKKVVWKGLNPIVYFMDRIYQTGIKVSNQELQEIENFIQRNPILKKWVFKINWEYNKSG